MIQGWFDGADELFLGLSNTGQYIHAAAHRITPFCFTLSMYSLQRYEFQISFTAGSAGDDAWFGSRFWFWVSGY